VITLASTILGMVAVLLLMIGALGVVAVSAHMVLGGQTPEMLRSLAKFSLGMLVTGAGAGFFWFALVPLQNA